MRDPKRIKHILNKLEEVWNETPDQRFLQMIHNILREDHLYSDPFYIEDNTLLTSINKYSERNKMTPIFPTEEELKEITTPKKKKPAKRKK